MAARKRITQEQIVEMNERFAEIGNKAQIAREMGVSPSTVARYIIEGYVPQAEREIQKVETSIGEDMVADQRLLEIENWGNLFAYTEEEEQEMEVLRREILS